MSGVMDLVTDFYRDFQSHHLVDQIAFVVGLTSLFGAPGGAVVGVVVRRWSRKAIRLLEEENAMLSAALKTREERLTAAERDASELRASLQQQSPLEIRAKAEREQRQGREDQALTTVKYGIDELAGALSWMFREFGTYCLERSDDIGATPVGRGFLEASALLGGGDDRLAGLIEEAKEIEAAAAAQSGIYDPFDERFEPDDYLGTALDRDASMALIRLIQARAKSEADARHVRTAERLLLRACAVARRWGLDATDFGFDLRGQHAIAMFNCGYYEALLEVEAVLRPQIEEGLRLRGYSNLVLGYVGLLDMAAHAKYALGRYEEAYAGWGGLIGAASADDGRPPGLYDILWRQAQSLALRKLGRNAEALCQQLAILPAIKSHYGPQSNETLWSRIIICFALGGIGRADLCGGFLQAPLGSHGNVVEVEHHMADDVQAVAILLEDERVVRDPEYCRARFAALPGPRPYMLAAVPENYREPPVRAVRDPATWRSADAQTVEQALAAEDTTIADLAREFCGGGRGEANA
jgi:hypothetical protein